mmetsp:Transcript_53077/g.119364  ORF Transcript_53077/g.119364 Transcript_53077/m.119364 type:complete len:319 (+) Transcript_53077:310-1266(+)
MDNGECTALASNCYCLWLPTSHARVIGYPAVWYDAEQAICVALPKERHVTLVLHRHFALRLSLLLRVVHSVLALLCWSMKSITLKVFMGAWAFFQGFRICLNHPVVEALRVLLAPCVLIHLTQQTSVLNLSVAARFLWLPVFVVRFCLLRMIQSFASWHGVAEADMEDLPFIVGCPLAGKDNKLQGKRMRLNDDIVDIHLLVCEDEVVPSVALVPGVLQNLCRLHPVSHHKQASMVSILVDISPFRSLLPSHSTVTRDISIHRVAVVFQVLANVSRAHDDAESISVRVHRHETPELSDVMQMQRATFSAPLGLILWRC